MSVQAVRLYKLDDEPREGQEPQAFTNDYMNFVCILCTVVQCFSQLLLVSSNLYIELRYGLAVGPMSTCVWLMRAC